MNLQTRTVETTGLVRGQRVFREITVEVDVVRGIERDFIEGREDKPAQHRIFVRDTTNRFEREIGPQVVPTLITRFTDEKHAPYAIIGDLTVVYGKTTKTACGKRVKTDQLVRRETASCPDCVKRIAQDRAAHQELVRAARELGMNVDA